MSFATEINKPSSNKIVLAEIDAPLDVTWINYQPGIWFTNPSPGSQLVEDDNGNSGYWGDRNSAIYNIGSLSVGGETYAEASSIANCIATNKSWFEDITTHYIYAHFDSFNPPCVYGTIAPGAIVGFTLGEDKTNNNYFQDIYYFPSVKSVFNLTKKKDSLFFGLLQYQGGTITFHNEDGYFDTFSKLNLYGQPIRIRLTFEGEAYSDSLLVYSGRVGKTSHDFETFKLQIDDTRKLLSRKLPVNVLADGTPTPLIFGSVINVPAYRTSSGNWTFADTTYNSIVALSAGDVVDKDGVTFTHSGTGTDGTFTGADTTDKLYVTCEQSTVVNGLDIISHILENYENKTYNSTNYDTTEWSLEKASVMDEGIWIGKGNLMTSVDVIEQVCTDNQGVFDVLADGRFTFRSYNAERIPTYEIFADELLDVPGKIDDPEELLTSVKIEYSKDWLEKESELYTNSDYQAEVFGRSKVYKEQTFKTCLTSEADATTLSESIMDLSKLIFPIMGLQTKTQNIGVRVLDNLLYTYVRQNGNEVLARSRFQVLGVTLNLSNYEVGITIKQIEEDDNIYAILDGGTPSTAYDYYDGGTPTSIPDSIITGRII